MVRALRLLIRTLPRIDKDSEGNTNEHSDRNGCRQDNTTNTCDLRTILVMGTYTFDFPPRQMVPLTCDVCGRSFSSRSNLNRHTRDVHNSYMGSFKCPQCGGKEFKNISSLRFHIYNVHVKNQSSDKTS